MLEIPGTHAKQSARLLEVFSPSLLLFLLLITALKFVLAATTWGTADSWIWEKFAHDVKNLGQIGLYYQPYPKASIFNHPPFMANFISAAESLYQSTGLPPRFWIRSLCTLADVGTICVIARFLRPELHHENRVRLWWFLAAPATVLLSGFHGNSDPIMMFFVLLTLLLLHEEKAPWLAGLAFGMSLSIKIVPLIFLPVLWLHLRTPRRIFEYSISAVLLFVVSGLPATAQDAPFILKRLFGYSGTYGVWGWSRALSLIVPTSSDSIWLSAVGKYALMASLVMVSWWMNRFPRRIALSTQCAVIAMLFLTLTPSFGNQYLAWLLPLLFAIELRWSRIIFASCSLMLMISYFLWWKWRYPYPPQDLQAVQIAMFAALACWFSIAVVLLSTLKTLASPISKAMPHAEPIADIEYSI